MQSLINSPLVWTCYSCISCECFTLYSQQSTICLVYLLQSCLFSCICVCTTLCMNTIIITNLTQQELEIIITTMQQPGRSDTDNYATALHKKSVKQSLRTSFSVNFLFLRVSLIFMIRCRRLTFLLFCFLASRFFRLTRIL